MKNKIKNLFAIALTGFVFLFAACDTSLSLNKRKNNDSTDEEKLVQIHLLVQQTESRSALPDYDYENIDLSEVTDVIFSYENSSISKRSMNFEDVEELEAAEIHLPEGTYEFILSAKYKGLSFYSHVTQAIIFDEDNTISFALHPNAAASAESGDYGTVKISLVLPEDTVATFDGGRITLNGSEFTISNTDYTIDTETNTFVFEKRLPPSFYWYMIQLNLVDQNHNVFRHSTSALIQKDTVSVEEYEIEEFFKGYTITWHIPEEDDVLSYYATTYGYDLLLSKNYNWFTDADKTVAATAASAGVESGDKEFWATVNTAYGFVNIYDIDNPTVPIKRLTIPSNKYFYIYTNYNVTAKGSTSSEDETFNIDCREGYYVSGIYRDAEKNSSYGSSSYYYSSYKNIYVKYKPYKTLTLVSVGDNPGEIIGTHLIKDSYKLYNYSIYFSDYFNNGQSWDFVSLSKAYYSDSSKAENKKLYTDYNYYPEENVTIYVDDYLEPVYKVKLINKKTGEVIRQFTEKYNFTLYDNEIGHSNYGYSYGNYYADSYYVKDSNGEYVNLEKKSKYTLDPETITAIDEDLNLEIYIDLLPTKSVTLSYKYYVPYKLKILDEENNSRLVMYSDKSYVFIDKNIEYIWYFGTGSSGTSSVSFTYVPLDDSKLFKFENQFEEIASANEEPMEVERKDLYGNYDQYTLVESENPIIWYQYNLEGGRKYTLNYSSSASGENSDVYTKSYWYVISPDNTYVNNSYSSSYSTFTPSVDGVYKLIFKPYYNSDNEIKIKYQLNSIFKSTGNITATIISSDLNAETNPITVTKTETAYELTAPAGYSQYEWLIGGNSVASGKTCTLNFADYIGLENGTETYYITLKTKSADDNSKTFWFTTTFKLEVKVQEAGNDE